DVLRRRLHRDVLGGFVLHGLEAHGAHAAWISFLIARPGRPGPVFLVGLRMLLVCVSVALCCPGFAAQPGPGCSDGEAAPQVRVALEFSCFCRWILLPSRTTPRGVVFTRKPEQPPMLGSYLPGRPQDVVASRVAKLTLPRSEVNRRRREICDTVPKRRRGRGNGGSGGFRAT